MEKLGWRGALKEHRWWLFIVGVLMIALGVLTFISALSKEGLFVILGLFAVFWPVKFLSDMEKIRSAENVIPIRQKNNLKRDY